MSGPTQPGTTKYGWAHKDDGTECVEPAWCPRPHVKTPTATAPTPSGSTPTPHDHRQPVPGCFRCELNEDEMSDGSSTVPKTCADLYAMPVEGVRHDLHDLAGCYYNHIPEVPDLHTASFKNYAEWSSPRVEIRTIRRVDFDPRRYWELATVWFDKRPVMVIQNAGREGDDHAQRFITDPEAYRELVGHIASLLPIDDPDGSDVVDPNETRSDLTTFYGDDLRTVSARGWA